MSQAQGLGELGADVPATIAHAVVELRQALGADHRLPRSRQQPDDAGGGDLDPAAGVTVEQRRGLDRRAGRLVVIVDGGHGGDGVPRSLTGGAGRIGEGRVGHGSDPRFADL